MKTGIEKLNNLVRRFRANSLSVLLVLIALTAVISGIALSIVINAGSKVEADIFTDGTYTEKYSGSTFISVKGRLPDGVSAKAYPVQADVPGVIYASYDITLFDKDGGEYQPEQGAVEVSIESPALKDAIENGMSLEVYHIDDSGAKERIDTVSVGDETVSFSAESFSTYVIVDHEGGEVQNRRVTYYFLDKGEQTAEDDHIFTSNFYEFKNSSGNTVSREIVKNGEKLTEPPTPPPIYNEDGTIKFRFYGWYRVNLNSIETQNGKTAVKYSWPADDSRYDFDQAVTVGENDDGQVYYLAALYQNSRFIVFHEDELGEQNEGRFSQKKIAALNSNKADAYANILISDASAPLQKTNQEYFYGWMYFDSQGNAHEEPLYTEQGDPISTKTIRVDASLFSSVDVVQNGVTYTVNNTNTLDLYPVYKLAHWLNFDTNALGSGALYISSKFVMSNTVLTSLEPTNMKGYRFDGWYTAADGGVKISDGQGNLINGAGGAGVTVSGGKLTMTQDATLYAHWTAVNDSTYRVVYWFEKPDGDGYAYGSIREITGQTAGAMTNVTAPATPAVTIPNGEKAAGFHLYGSQSGETDTKYIVTNQKISNDDSTVINVYYARNIYSVKFYGTVYTAATYGIYGLVQGSYEQLYYKTTGWLGGESYHKETENGNHTTVYYINGNAYIQYSGQRYNQGSGWAEINELTITGKYGSDIHNLWPSVREGMNYPSNWYVSTSQTTMQSSITTMPLNGANFYYYEDSGRYEFVTNYWTQNVSGGNEFSLYSSNSFKGNTNDYYTTIEEYTSIQGFLINIDPNGGKNNQKNNSIDAEERTYDTGCNVSDDMGTYYRDKTDYTIDIYYIRRKYNIRFNFNDNDQSQTVISDIYYEQDISDKMINDLVVDETEMNIGNKDMIFKGWYDNEACIGDPYDFSGKKMPAHDLVLYAKWDLKWYLVQVDPSGGELQDGDSTWFWVEHGSSVSRYNLTNNYIEASPDYNGIRYYYAYEKYDPEYDRSSSQYDPQKAEGSVRRRRAKYITEDQFSQYEDWDIDKTTVYQQSPDAYSLKGWYIVGDNDQETHIPYRFEDQVVDNVKIRAIWRRTQTYYIRYESQNVAEGSDGELHTIRGNLAEKSGDPEVYTVHDPGMPSLKIGYSDKAIVSIHSAPENYDAIDGTNLEWEFEGWRPYLGDQPVGMLYSAGNDYIIDAKYADSANVITMRAEYKARSQSYHTPRTVSLFLDGNGENRGSGQIINGADYSDERFIGTIESYTSGSGYDVPAGTLNKGIAFVGEENNFDVVLKNYGDAFVTGESGIGGRSVFESATGYLLLGWDMESDPDTIKFIPSYYTDGTIGMDKITAESEVLYAVWEPLLYLTFENRTQETLEFSLNGLDVESMSIINVVDGVYQRTRYTDSKIIVPAANGTEPSVLKLVLPKASGDGTGKFNISGESGQLREGKILKVQTTAVSPDQSDEGIEFNNDQTFTLKQQATLRPVVNPSESGVKVTFTEREEWTLDLSPNHDNLPVSTQTFDSLTGTTVLPNPVRVGYTFKGWSRTYNGDVEFNGTEELADIFTSSHHVTLYAVWQQDTADSFVYIYNNVTGGFADTEKEFEYTVTVKKGISSGSINTSVASSGSGPVFTLKHGEKAKLKITVKRSSSSYTYTVTLEKDNNVTKFEWTNTGTAYPYFTVEVMQNDYSSEGYTTTKNTSGVIESKYGNNNYGSVTNPSETVFRYTNSWCRTSSYYTAAVLSGQMIFNNNCPAVAPTGVTNNSRPFVIIFILGSVLAGLVLMVRTGIAASAVNKLHSAAHRMKVSICGRGRSSVKHSYSAFVRNNKKKAGKPEEEVRVGWI